MKAPLPLNETQRLEALHSYGILDTPPEQGFDDITLIASQICQVPIVLVSLVDESRQWFKSRIGLEMTETSRDFAFCAHAILRPGDILEVRDAQADPRFVDNPLVFSDPRIRFYAGASLVTSDGHALGTLCAIDHVPRELNAPQKEALRALSRQVVALLELRRTLVKHKYAENALRVSNEELRIATEQAQAADRIKSAFLATMSHELRTPLNSIIGFTGVILQGLAGPLNPEQGKQLEMVRSSARHLLALINDVLDISKIEAGQFEVTHALFDLRASIVNVVNIITPLAEKKALVLRFSLPPELGYALSDKRRFEQILLNLLSNAVKFTEHGEVALTAESIADAASLDGLPPVRAVRICISDTGIGINEDDMTTVFQPFRQLDSGLARNHEGTGLGLAICRCLVKLMGGEISATSIPGQGSTFCFTLPLAGTLA